MRRTGTAASPEYRDKPPRTAVTFLRGSSRTQALELLEQPHA